MRHLISLLLLMLPLAAKPLCGIEERLFWQLPLQERNRICKSYLDHRSSLKGEEKGWDLPGKNWGLSLTIQGFIERYGRSWPIGPVTFSLTPGLNRICLARERCFWVAFNGGRLFIPVRPRWKVAGAGGFGPFDPLPHTTSIPQGEDRWLLFSHKGHIYRLFLRWGS
ncbi:MAG: hypothetical protein C6I00_06890 [Nitratiruptor sp.]|nr:hypothetical protein [Nitratiruptor sp.]NPA83763.1 hypothetical protein [Campylobacterota bacterium]